MNFVFYTVEVMEIILEIERYHRIIPRIARHKNITSLFLMQTICVLNLTNVLSYADIINKNFNLSIE